MTDNAEPQLCRAYSRWLRWGGSLGPCVKDPGHEGMHRDASGACWQPGHDGPIPADAKRNPGPGYCYMND